MIYPAVNTKEASFSGYQHDEAWRTPLWKKPSLIDPDTFLFLNERGALSSIGWNGSEKSALWRYNQHYFDDLTSTDSASRTEWHKTLIADWIANNPCGSGVGWDPYPTSLRIVNWIKWGAGPGELSAEFVQNLGLQSRHLFRRLEYHLLGNHLLANAKALIFAGGFFHGQEAERWFQTGLDVFMSQISEQLLSDGGHFERSTMYHAIVLEDLLDVLCLLQKTSIIKNADKVADRIQILRNEINKMFDWLETMTHPDGKISFFNDSAFGIAPTYAQLSRLSKHLGFQERDLAAEPHLTKLSESGYVRIDNHGLSVIVDVAPISGGYLTGHGHADILSFEASIHGQRLLVNSGTSIYEYGIERFFQRSTKAHNTVEINGENSSEIWSSFRVGARAKPTDLYIKQQQETSYVSCSHDGYERLKGKPRHTRSWIIKDDRFVIEDLINGDYKTAVSYFYFHPSVNLVQNPTPAGTKFSICMGADQEKVGEIHCSSERVELVEALWFPEFGVSEPNFCLEVTITDRNNTFVLSF